MDDQIARFVAASEGLRRVARAMSNDLGVDPEDLLHDAIVKGLRKLQRGESIDKPRAYLRRVMMSDLYHRRLQYMQRREVDNFLGRVMSAMTMDDSPALALEAREVLRAAHNELTRSQCQIYFLRVVGYNNEEIARMIGKTKGAVAASLTRSRATLRPFLEDIPDSSPDADITLENFFAAIAAHGSAATPATDTLSSTQATPSAEVEERPPGRSTSREVVSARAELNS